MSHSTVIRIGAILACALISPPCLAEIYRCTAANGTVVFADMPCGTDAQVQQVKPVRPSSNSNVAAPAAANRTPPNDPQIRERVALLCATRDFNAWVRAQPSPLPEPQVRLVKLAEATRRCRAALNLPDTPPGQSASTVRPEAAQPRSPPVAIIIERGANLQSVTCRALDGMSNARSPPALYLGVADCIRHEQYPQATELFVLAGLDSQFDAERVKDKNGQQAGQPVLLSALAGITPQQREQFSNAVQALHSNPQALAMLCERTRKIGYPTYFPDYMVMHGTSSLTLAPRLSALKPQFDSATTWTLVQMRYLNCG